MNTDNLVAASRTRFSHASAKRLLREKYEARLLFAYSGGMFKAGPELQSTLLTCPDATAVILDLYNNPVKVDTKELFAKSQQHWQEQMNAWLVEFDEIYKKR